jgi:ligand-binding sensor domain-containing protein/signal transduction histidine kinase
MMRRRWWLYALLAGALHAGAPPLRLFTTDDGLVRNWVTRIRRDSRGFLWFCTVEGVSIFDGYRFTNFTTRDGLPNRQVRDVVETHDGNYWIATASGVSRFYPTALPGTGHFENFHLDAAPAANAVSRLIEDSQHTIWCATGAGLYRFAPSAGTIHPEVVHLEEGANPSVVDLFEDGRHRLWILGFFATGEYRLWVRDVDGSMLRVQQRDLPILPKVMVQDAQGRVWVGGKDLVGLSTASERPTVIARYRQIAGENLDVSSLHVDAGGDLWIGAHMLIRFRPDAEASGRFRVFPTTPVLYRQFVLALESDAAGNLWAGISNLGAARISHEPSELFTDADGLESRAVRALTESRTGTLFAITGRMALNEFAGERFSLRPHSVPSSVIDDTWGQAQLAVHDRRGRWWVASGSGLLCYPPGDDARSLAHSVPRVYTRRDGLPGPFVLRVFEDSRGDIWAGTDEGISRWDHATERWRSFGAVPVKQGDAPGAVHSITEDQSGAIWVGFASPRIMRIRDDKAELITEGVPPSFINALLVDHAGRLWIGSSQGGLARADRPQEQKLALRAYTMENGLSSNQVFSLAEDRWGRIYVADGRGVDRLDPESGAIRHFTAANGLPGGETEEVYRDRTGAIWFGSSFGLARYVPEPDHGDRPPQPLLRSVRIGGAELPVSVIGEHVIKGLELRPEQTSVEIEYRPLHFEAAQRLRFQYRLISRDTPWSDSTDLQTVHYASLAAGRYQFEVRSVGEDGAVSAPAYLEFHLLPPLWLRAWFLATVAIAVVAGAYSLYWYRVNQLLAVERVRTRLATDLHDDLGAGLAEIAISSELAKRNPHNRDLLDQIARRARAMRAALGDIVWTVDPSRDHLSDLVQRMRATALAMLEDDERAVTFRGPGDETAEGVELPPDLRRHFLLFFKEAVTNVARHAAATDVEIEVSLTGRRLTLWIRDNGRGFDPNTAVRGQGLASMRHRAAEMRAELRLVSTPAEGTEVRLCVPLPKSLAA